VPSTRRVLRHPAGADRPCSGAHAGRGGRAACTGKGGGADFADDVARRCGFL